MKTKITIFKKILFAFIFLFAINWIGNFLYGRFDLTEDKRYTITDASKNYLDQIQDTIRFSVYLEGDLPVSFSKMKREVSDLLHEFKRISGSHIQIMFIDPAKISEGKNGLKNTYKRLTQYGLKPYTIQEENEEGKIEQRYIIPGIIISTSQKFVPINLLGGAIGNSTDEQIFNALQQLEYQCIKGMMQLTTKNRKNIAFLTDHKEWDFQYVFDATMSIMEGYNVDRITTQNLLDSIEKYDVLIIAKPKIAFTEKDKYVLDQYVMRGGNVLGFFDMVDVDADSLKYYSHTYALPMELNINDLLFNWGVRINNTIVLDKQCAKIPINVATPGSQPRFEPAPWYYYPLLRPEKGSTITHNIDLVKSEFANNIDTVTGNGINKKTILLTSTKFSRAIPTPTSVGFSILEIDASGNYLNNINILSVLLEGNYNSLYKSRVSPFSANELPKGFKQIKQSENSKIIIVSDGDVIRNEIEVKGTDTVPKPLHYYKYFAIDKRVFRGNKDFIMNSVNYLAGDTKLLDIRSRELKIRLLNKNRIIEEKEYWQLFNIILPIVVMSILGVFLLVIRKRKYAKKHVS